MYRMQNVIVFFLTVITLELIFASPRVKHVSKSQAITRNNTKNAKTGHKKIVRNDYNFEDDGSVNKNTDEKFVERPLAVGDTFTARELLPVAQKLFEKVENPGEGKGIVSSSKRPQDLADKLFQGFFMTSSRIVRLKDEDIKGLDALQRLALVGDPAIRTNFAKQTSHKHKKVINLNGQRVKIDSKEGNKSRFKVLIKRIRNKAIKKKEPKKAKAKRRGNVKLINKLGRNRHLIVQRKNMNDTRKTSQNMAPCHWSYECKDPADLDSCQLQAKCIERKPNQRIDHSQYIKNNLEIDPNIVAQFRRALSITALDEEVEKILENRILQLKPRNLASSEKIESLSEYFRKIVDAELNGEAITKSVTEDSNDYGDVYADDQITVKPGNKNIAEKPQVVKLDAASDNDQVVKGRQNITALDLGHRAVATILG